MAKWEKIENPIKRTKMENIDDRITRNIINYII